MDLNLHPSSFHGKATRSEETLSFRLTEYFYPAHFTTAPHSHEYAYLAVILSGGGTQSCDKRVRACGPRTVFFNPPGEIHSDHFHSQGSHQLTLELGPGRLSLFQDSSCRLERPVESQGGRGAVLAEMIYGEFRQMDAASPIAIEGLTIALMAEMLRPGPMLSKSVSPPWLRQVSDLIHDRYTERLTLRDLAEGAGVHPVHLAREFHRRMGRTIGQQIRHLRIEHACRLLSKGSQSLVEVGLATGFSDQSQFTRTFKAVAGVTPMQYRLLRPNANFRQDR
ncbi:MAG TPA: AraC family transcriptional regulator [Terriglobia bacterium]|nr:AraC family transcriptional regulator [Terriglobia bacterium]